MPRQCSQVGSGHESIRSGKIPLFGGPNQFFFQKSVIDACAEHSRGSSKKCILVTRPGNKAKDFVEHTTY